MERTWWKDKILDRAFSQYCGFSTATHILSFHRVLSTTVMSTDVSQVGVALFPSFQHFSSFHLFRFSFCIIILDYLIQLHCDIPKLIEICGTSLESLIPGPYRREVLTWICTIATGRVVWLFADECCLLPNQVMIPQLNPPTKIVAVASPALFYQSLPIQVSITLHSLLAALDMDSRGSFPP